MTIEKRKVLLDFDGNLTNEEKQAAELKGIALSMLADILAHPISDIEAHYQQIKDQILQDPHLYPWEVNGLPACYAYEGAYLLNTGILQHLLRSNPHFQKIVEAKFSSPDIDPVTACVNHLFHEGSLSVNPHFLPEARDFLIDLITNTSLEPIIFTNSETRKIAANLRHLEIGAVSTTHAFPHEIGVLGDTRQYYLDRNWPVTFDHPTHGPIQILPIGDDRFQIELRRPIYYAALSRLLDQGYHDIVVVADGFTLAGALPLMMGLSFILHKTSFTPTWAESYVANHPRGRVASGLAQVRQAIDLV